MAANDPKQTVKNWMAMIRLIRVFTWLLLLHFVGAQAEDGAADEKAVKASIQDGTAMYICQDQVFLDTVNLDKRTCRSEVSRYSVVCWQMLDKLIPDYSLPLDDRGKGKYSDLSDVFTHCVQAKLLLSEMEFRNYSQKN